MRIPIIVLAAGWVQGLPAAGYFLSRMRTRTSALIVVGALVSLLSNFVGRILAQEFGNNQIGSYISSPVTAAFFLAALAEFQATARERRVMLVGILGFVVVWISLIAFVEDMTDFDRVTGPFYSLTIMLAGIWTLLRRARDLEATPLLGTDWFWIALGVALSGACTVVASPLGAILVERGEFELFSLVWQVRAGLLILSYLAIAWGIYRGPASPAFATDD